MLHRGVDKNLYGDQGAVGQRGNKGATFSAKRFFSQIFLVKKKEGGQRPIMNLKCLNSFVKTKHFKMEGLHILPHFIQQNDWMIKMDLKDACLQIPIHQESQQLQWKDKIINSSVSQFRLTPAPRVFSKVMKPVLRILRHLGIRSVIYLDNLLILHQG